jgi:protein CpxP
MKEDAMNVKTLVGAVAILSFVGLNVQPGLASPDRDYSHGAGGEQGYWEEMKGHQSHAADHLRHLLKHEKEIGLTEEQIKKLKTIELDYDRMHIKAEADIHVAERELRALVEDEKTELSALEAKVKQSEMLEVGLRMAAFKARRDALAVLTTEQREKAKAAHEKRMHEMMSGAHGAMPGNGH